MLKQFENWLLQQKYSALTSSDYTGRIERLCRNNKYTLEHLIKNISNILPEYEKNGKWQEKPLFCFECFETFSNISY